MNEMLSRSIADIASALRRGEFSATELITAALDRHAQFGERLQAYKLFDAEGALESARAADQVLASDDHAPPLTGIPISVKDLYGVDGLPTFAGTPKQLPEKWSRDAWLVAQLRGAGAITVGKTHMVEMAFGAVGINPNWETPWNPWDAETHRIPGGSSSGAGVSLWEGSALIALGSDTGGSIRIPAAFTGTVGQRTTKGRWPTEGVVPLSPTRATAGAPARTFADYSPFSRRRAPVGAAPPSAMTTDGRASSPPVTTRRALWGIASLLFRLCSPRAIGAQSKPAPPPGRPSPPCPCPSCRRKAT